MKIFATFANRKYDPNDVELVHAWDEYSFDNNPTGYEDTKREAVASLGDDLLHSITALIEIDAEPIYAALTGPVRTTGRVQLCSE